jgi:hypothetical protein
LVGWLVVTRTLPLIPLTTLRPLSENGVAMSDAMEQLLITTLISAVVSVLFGSVAAAIVSHFLAISRADKEYRLKKLEELFIAVQFWCNHLKKVYFNLGEVAAGHLPWNEARLRDLPRIEQAEASYATALVLSNVFFKDLTFPLEQISKFVDELWMLRTQFKAIHGDFHPLPDYVTQFGEGMNRLQHLQNEFNELSSGAGHQQGKRNNVYQEILGRGLL